MKKIKKNNKPVTKISPKELKFWLRGILEFQSDEWIPNKEQWDSIKAKIFALEEELIAEQYNSLPNSLPPPRIAQPVMNQMRPQELSSSSGETGGVGLANNATETFQKHSAVVHLPQNFTNNEFAGIKYHAPNPFE